MTSHHIHNRSGFFKTLQRNRSGFFKTFQRKRGRTAAGIALNIAFDSIRTTLPKETRLDHIHEFLDSEYGGYMAEQVIEGGMPVRDQIEARPTRFLKKFAQIERRVGTEEI